MENHLGNPEYFDSRCFYDVDMKMGDLSSLVDSKILGRFRGPGFKPIDFTQFPSGCDQLGLISFSSKGRAIKHP